MIPLLIALFVRSEHRGLKRLQQFVSARLLPQLAGTVNRRRRILRFGLLLLGLALAIISLAQPRWGYTFEDVKRKGLDLLVAVDTSRSMLSNDVQPNRLERVKLAIQDLIGRYSKDPAWIKIESVAQNAPQVEQIYFEVDRRSKVEVLCRLIDIQDVKFGLIFCATKVMCDELTDQLNARGYEADKLHGDMSQQMRERVLSRFRDHKVELLV